MDLSDGSFLLEEVGPTELNKIEEKEDNVRDP